MTSLGSLRAALEREGLALRGAFHPQPEDGVPTVAGAPAGTLVLVGWTGGTQWPVFAASPEAVDGAADPLDRWSRRVLGAIATRFAAVAIDPSQGPPWYPFQRWALRAGRVAPSPLGLLIDADEGLWHAYRGALAFAAALPLPPNPPTPPAPCDTCTDRPCLRACPVRAHDDTGFAAERCTAHVLSSAGMTCRHHGCEARRACPVRTDQAYGEAQAAFHMSAFLARTGVGPADDAHGRGRARVVRCHRDFPETSA